MLSELICTVPLPVSGLSTGSHEICVTALLRLNKINLHTADLFPLGKRFLLGQVCTGKNTGFNRMRALHLRVSAQ
jgi:hypothetical protein